MTDHLLLHDLLEAASSRAPEAPAVSWRGGSLRYGELAAASREAAAALAARGVSRGDRVILSARDVLATAAAIYGTSRLGAAFSVVHTEVRGLPLVHVLRDSEPAALVTDDEAAADTARSLGVACLSPDELRQAHDPAPARPVIAVDMACLIYTSGTTSLPKAVVSTHQQMRFAIEAIQDRLAYREDDIVYCPLPLSFDYGLYQLFLSTRSGAHLWLGEMAQAGPLLLRSLEEAEATILAGIPSVTDSLAWLLERAKGERLPRLRLLTNTGAALSGQTIARLRSALPRLRVQVMYGLTECKRTTIMPPDGDLERPDSCGLPLAGTEVVILDDDGNELPAGETGQIVVRGPHVMSGYWRRPELNAQRFPRREGLFPELHTGDYGHLDSDGYLYFSGRRDDLYKERGFRISCTEVEAAACRLEAVTSAAVLPPEGRHKALLAVVSELTGDEVLKLMREQIEPFKIPRFCVTVDQLPVTANGKVDRKALAATLRPE